MAMILRSRTSGSLSRLRLFSRTFSTSGRSSSSAPQKPEQSAESAPRPVRFVPPLPVVPENSFWTTLTPPSRTVFPRGVNRYTIMDFLKCFDGFDVYHPKFARKFKTLKDFLLVRVRTLKKMKMPRNHRKVIIKFTHRYRMGIWKPEQLTYKPDEPDASPS